MSVSTILVVDDEPGIRDLLQWELSSRGHEVQTCVDGLGALEVLRQNEFDLVITDVRMPGLDGIGVLQATKELSPDTEVVVTTGYAELERAIECVRFGAFDLLQKPFEMRSLLGTVDRALERRRLRETASLYELGQAVLAPREAHRLPERIVEVALRLMAADDVSLMLPGPDGRLHLACSHGLGSEIQAQAVLALGERIASRIAACREPVLISDDISKDPRFKDIPSHGRVRSSIVFPLVAGERLAGVLNLSRVAGSRPFRKRDLERATLLAAQVLLALQNQQLVRQLVATERLASVGQLAASVGHELNNPITYVLANHALLRERLEALARLEEILSAGAAAHEVRAAWDAAGGRAGLRELREVLAEAEEGAGRVRDIARDLRVLARPDDGQPRAVDLNEVIRSALRMAGPGLGARCRVVTRLGPDVGVEGCSGRLIQVFVNLLVNAGQALADHPGSGEVTIATWREGDRVLASVCDNGPGVRPEHRGRIFEPFFTTKAGIGTGLGLCICREIALAHGGDLRLDVPEGPGSAFTLVLPAASFRPAAHQGQTLAAPPAPVRRPRLLIIDDEPAILKAFARARGRRYEISTAQGGEQALEVLGRGPAFDLVLCDLHMPDLDGLEVYRRLLEDRPEQARAFVLVTGGTDDPQVRDLVATRAVRLLRKPFDLAAIDELLAQPTGRSGT